ncbi:MAG: hypothetical protein AAFU41_16500 [Pseudomonadota bacterium]
MADESDRIQIFFWVADDRWWKSYRRLLGFVDSVANIFLGNALVSWKSFFRTLALAWIYPYILIILFFDFRQGLSGTFGLTLLIWIGFFATSTIIYLNGSRSEAEDVETSATTKIAVISIKFFAGILISATLGIIGFNIGSYYFSIDPIIGFFVCIGSISLFLATVLFFGEFRATVVFLIFLYLSITYLPSFTEFEFLLTPRELASSIEFVVALSIQKGLQVGGYVAIVVMLIPLANAFLDWLSWIASRFLVRRLAKDAEKHAWLGAICHILLDIVIAAALLIFVAIALSFAFYMLGLAEVWRGFQFDPWGREALPTTLMICSTLVPTLVHLTMAVLALASRRLPGSSFALDMLEVKKPSTMQRHAAVLWLFAYVFLAFSVVLGALNIAVLLAQNGLNESLLHFLYRVTSTSLPWEI